MNSNFSSPSSQPLQNRSQLQKLYRDHFQWLCGWLGKHTRCPEHAADLAHDTFCRVMTADAIESLREPRAWLTTTARRLLIDQFRRQEREAACMDYLALASEGNGEPSLEQAFIARESLQTLVTTLDSSSEKQRLAFLMHYVEKQPRKSVAVQLGISPRTLGKYLHQTTDRCQPVLAGMH